jgi:uncharacterized Zn finger protein
MNVDQADIQNRCTDAVFERGRTYRDEGHIRRIDRFDGLVTATVHGSSQYDVTTELDGDTIDARCTCPYDGPGDCKHVVAVLLEVAVSPPPNESDRVESVLDDVSATDLRTFVRDACADYPGLRDRLLARFGQESKAAEEYRSEIELLFDQHTQDYSVVTGTIDFSRFFDLAERYREREHYLAAATIYRALFEAIDDNQARIDAAYDHYATALQSALDGYVDCISAADPDPDAFESFASVLDERAAVSSINGEQFRRALVELEDGH